ncbi:sugar ABC transporter substrate-binding protein [Fusibacter sp. 3D3]|uniref:sugar ABC transporter substrate-binding protein n=1 Tax=Fusibacter sp. 3D3 TaxID=1048380 RepID=UPI0008582CF9|nr:substrate-binding domain-containing protein [Fusibacter sp. 3D3]GAU77577.1 xylose ABC transporter periplasmic xylose-binding protein XylF [Fusibacter sp. 3D3]
MMNVKQRHIIFKTLILMGSIMTILVISVACGQIKSNTTEQEMHIKIGLAFDSFVVERWQREVEVLVAKATEMGATVDVQIANESVEKQREQIQYLIAERMDVIIVVPKDATALADVLSEARRNGIKIIAYDRLVIDTPVDLYISFDNVGIGRGISERLVSKLDALYYEQRKENLAQNKPFNLLVINGDPKDHNSTLLNKGFYETLSPYVKSGKIKIVDEIWALEWRESYAKELVEKHLRKGEHIDGIIAANDVLATGAIETLAKWQLAGAVMVVSQDAELSACQRIVEKTQLATVYKPINDLAETCAKIAINMAKGEKVIANDEIDNGSGVIPYLKLDTRVVDADNIDAVIIQSGFHKESDVYINVTREEEQNEK